MKLHCVNPLSAAKGDEEAHGQLRQRVVAQLEAQREMYEPFVEDEEPWADYVARMAEDGEWAGHPELHAASVALRRNIQVHQHEQSIWQVTNWEEAEAAGPALTLSYHDGNHYNSLCKVAGREPAGEPAEAAWERAEESAEAARDREDVDPPPEALGGEEATGAELLSEAREDSSAPRVRAFVRIEGSRACLLLRIESQSGSNAFSDGSPIDTKARPKPIRPVRRNKACPCGSGLKYKSCCGAKGRAKRRAKAALTSDEGPPDKALSEDERQRLALLHI